VGLAGKPEHPEAFIRFQADGVDIYLAHDLLASLEPGTGRLLVHFPGYDNAWLCFQSTAI